MRVVVLGAGISGHTAALILRRKLGPEHEVLVISPKPKWNWIPSNIWVGVGKMTPEQVTFELKPVYDRKNIVFHQAKATEIYPEGSLEKRKPYVVAESTLEKNKGEKITVEYDYLVNATGPNLNYKATPGLGPDANSFSICTQEHAYQTSQALDKLIQEMKNTGKKKTFVVGTGHGICTCEGAAFEYVFNLEFKLKQEGVRHLARIIFLTNEPELADFGVGGMYLKSGGVVNPGKVFAESLFVEREVDWILRAHVNRVEKNYLQYETLSDESGTIEFDFAMLIPPFTGVPLKAFDQNGAEITKLFNPAGFMKVDADYNAKTYEQWAPADWPRTYQTEYKNIFSIGIAFAPPHQLSKPQKNKNGTLITPAPPRTGMPSAIMGRTVANSIADMIYGVSKQPTHTSSMADLGAACVASAGAHALSGSAVSITMYPIVPNYEKYPTYGRSLLYTTGEIGLAGHWIKQFLHYAFIYKAKAHPFWWIIPE
ncbi:MAG: NAD(P)/FAD-dependent oxidoreductase [Bdellovibrio sp.]